MARNEKRRQQALERKAAKRKQKQKSARQPIVPGSPRGMLRRAADWPVYEVMISRDWQRHGADELVQILVARRSPGGEIAAGSFLVDLGCLGVKNALGKVLDTIGEYEELRIGLASRQPMVETDLNVAAKVVREAIEYARQLGFSPHRDYYDVAPLLEGADPDAAPVEVPLGKDGKPFFVAGPYDNVPRIMAQLTKAVGPPDNFHYLVPVELPGNIEDELEGDEDEDEDGGEGGGAASGAAGKGGRLAGLRRLLSGGR